MTQGKTQGLEHFESALFNISDAKIITGKTLHTICRKANMKARVTLTNKNVVERMYV